MFRMQKIFWKQPIVCHRLEECYFLQNIYLGVEVADDSGTISSLLISSALCSSISSVLQQVGTLTSLGSGFCSVSRIFSILFNLSTSSNTFVSKSPLR